MSVSSGTVTAGVGASGNCPARMAWGLRGLCVVGLGISSYLAWTALNMSPVFGCEGGSIIDCDHVLHSKWSKVFGMPVSIPAGGLYASLLVMLAFVRKPAPKAFSQLLWSGLTAGALMAGLAALWFIGLQVFVLKHLCPYCLGVHACGLVLAVLLLRNKFTTTAQKRTVASVAVFGIVLLVTTQVLSPDPKTYEEVRYDTPVDLASAPDQAGDSEEFSAPVDLFEPPAEFEAPGTEEDSAEASSEAQASRKADAIPKESVKAETAPSAGATLLLIVPTRVWLLSNMLSSLGQEGAETPAASDLKPVDSESGDTTSEKESPGQEAAKQEADTKTPAAEPEQPKAPERRMVTVAGNRITLDVKQWPLLGKPDARYVFVEMFDYTCPHCRNTHHAIRGAFDQYGDDLAILALPVPLDRACNDTATGGGHAGACELAKIAVAVWRANPAKFREFHDWMFETTRSESAARAQAERLVGAEKFRKEYGSKIPSEYIKRHVDLYKKVGQGSVPKLLFPNSTINGEIGSKANLCSTIERELRDVAKQ